MIMDIILMDLMIQTSDDNDRLRANIVLYCNHYWWNCTALVILLINTLCLMNMLVSVWSLQKPLCGYYIRGFYCMTMTARLPYLVSCWISQWNICSLAMVRNVEIMYEPKVDTDHRIYKCIQEHSHQKQLATRRC